MDVSAQSLEDFSDDFTATGNSHTVAGEEQFAAQEERQLVGLSATFPAVENLDDILGGVFSKEIHDSDDVGKIDDDNKLSNALSKQFDEYLLQFNQVHHQPFSIEEDLNDNFDNLFPGLGFD